MFKKLVFIASIFISSASFAECLLMHNSSSDALAQIMIGKGYQIVQPPAEAASIKSVREMINIIPEGKFGVLSVDLGVNYRMVQLFQKRNNEIVLKAVADGATSEADLISTLPNCSQ